MDVQKFKEVYLKVDPNGADGALMIDRDAPTRGKQPLPGPTLAKFDNIIAQCNGMSRSRLMKLLNAAVGCMQDEEIYLEVGSYQGGSLVSALFENTQEAVAVDNFSQFQESNSEETLKRNLINFEMTSRAVIRNCDYRDYLGDFMPYQNPTARVGVYFYDGAHDTQSQLDGYELALPYLADQCLIFVDDYRYPEVKESIDTTKLQSPSR